VLAHYDRYTAFREKQHALALWADHVAALVGWQPRNMAALPPPALSAHDSIGVSGETII
jgi:hypothetical protein